MVDVDGYETLRNESNCEDATNVIAYTAYETFYGAPDFTAQGTIKTVDKLLESAAEFVQEHGPYYGIEWDEYRDC
jgi:hypothetical protein